MIRPSFYANLKKKGDKVFSINTWTGDGTSGSKFIDTGIDMTATHKSLAWVKNRDRPEQHRFIYRTGPSESVASSSTAKEDSSPYFTSVTNTGYYLSNYAAVNYNTSKIISWNFAVAPGFFDIVTWIGNSFSPRAIPHSLGTDVGMVMVKRRDVTSNWRVWHKDMLPTKYVAINRQEGESTSSTVWGGTAPTTSEFYVGNAYETNNSGGSYIGFVFAHNPSGNIQCGSYRGNSSTTTVDLGWQPDFIMIKNLDALSDWMMYDTARGISTGNGDKRLIANSVTLESDFNGIDLTATGFQVTGGDVNLNASLNDYIYIAIRE